jgi:hypothetical protein
MEKEIIPISQVKENVDMDLMMLLKQIEENKAETEKVNLNFSFLLDKRSISKFPAKSFSSSSGREGG